MGDILKEAIADAKAVRETALLNAKMALEEAFTPQLKSMLSAKLKEDDIESELEDVPAEEMDADNLDASELGYAEDETGDGFDSADVVEPEVEEEGEGEDEFGGEDEFAAEEPAFGGEEEIPAEEPEVEENIIELNGQSFKLVPISEEEEEFPAEEGGEFGEDELDLESIIRELETEINEEEDEEGEEVTESEDGYEGETKNVEGDEQANHVGGSMDESYEIDESLFEQEDENELSSDEEGTVEEQSDSSDIGSGDNKVDVADASDEEDPEGAGVHKQEFSEAVKELAEYKEAVKFLKDKLHEVNILNAKLLFTNKLFKEFALDNGQKMKVVENFDRAQTVREIKLVYATLAESFGDNSTVKRKSINESASSKSGSTKPSGNSRKVISEEKQVANRFKQLAGLS